jgi:hypothetical protein
MAVDPREVMADMLAGALEDAYDVKPEHMAEIILTVTARLKQEGYVPISMLGVAAAMMRVYCRGLIDQGKGDGGHLAAINDLMRGLAEVVVAENVRYRGEAYPL